MKINIGENLRKLRIRSELTQEQLAEIFNVSPQAISRWENNSSYPDITMLPSIANFYNISIDELIGMDEIRKAENLAQVFNKEHEHITCGRIDQAIDVLKEAIKLYPNNNGLLSELALAITLKVNNNEEHSLIEQAISLSQRVLENNISAKLRSTTTVNLCFLYLKAGKANQARDIVKSLPHIWESREILLPEMYDGDEYIEQLKKSIIKALTLICEKIKVSKNHKYGNLDNSIILGVDFNSGVDIKEMLDLINQFFDISVNQVE